MLIVYYGGVSEICINMIHGQPWWCTVSPSTQELSLEDLKDREQIKKDLGIRRWGKVGFIEGLQETSVFFFFEIRFHVAQFGLASNLLCKLTIQPRMTLNF